jgi:hypothetical protein
MPHIPTAFHGGQDLAKPASHEGRIEEGDGGGTVRGGNSQRPREKGTRTVRTVPREWMVSLVAHDDADAG